MILNRASPRFVILSGEKRRMCDNECQNSYDLSRRITAKPPPHSSTLNPCYRSKESAFLPPSLGRRCPEGAEVGSRIGIFTREDANPASLRSSAPSRGRGENDSYSGIALYMN